MVDTYHVPSKSHPGTFHIVTENDNQTYVCDCAGYQYRHYCSHVKQVKDGTVGVVKLVPEVPKVIFSYGHKDTDNDGACDKCGMKKQYWDVAQIPCRGYKVQIDLESGGDLHG
jgi:hypothetical protein